MQVRSGCTDHSFEEAEIDTMVDSIAVVEQ